MFTYFHCADRRTTLGSYPVMHWLWRNFTSAAVMTKSFEGSGSILMAGSGHPLIDAEYTWNLESSGYSLDPKTQAEFGRTFVELLNDTFRCDEIHAPGGFLDRAMDHIYGPGSAKLMRSLYLPQLYVEGLPAILPPQGRDWFDYCQRERSAYDSPKTNQKMGRATCCLRNRRSPSRSKHRTLPGIAQFLTKPRANTPSGSWPRSVSAGNWPPWPPSTHA